MPNTLARLRNLPLAQRQRWLRCLLICVAFSALHGLLGAWVVPAVASGPVFEVCTPQGVQWVLMDDTDSSRLGGQAPEKPLPQGLAQPCVWAMAHVAAPPVPLAPAALVANVHSAVRPMSPDRWEVAGPGNAVRVLLMSPMRAPPV